MKGGVEKMEKGKRIRVVRAIISLIMLGVFTLYWGVSHAATVVGSKHDLTIASGGGGFSAYDTTQICVFCHTPHNANTSAPLNGQYLWNRAVNTTTFTMYSSATLNATYVNPTRPGVQSLLCLSCHDGVGAFNALLRYPADAPNIASLGSIVSGNTFNNYLGDPNIGPLAIGSDLSNDHPVGFIYNAALAAADPTGTLATPLDAMRVDVAGKLRLFNGQMECATCHNPHDNDQCSTPGDCRFLVVNNAGSALCLTCHNK